ncbi:PREDICTED: ribonuclease 1-like [Nelumbo nucifera]|uniref:Uncharacterized protein n=2 Tax=Nelumbo nucifera TaxID=4432 RepID=A0A822YVW4_NELNU|nr:PREDICTED: ribonuclease 1-like [Nelumbo nucifera]DAD34886.1 TPA_asm: hypothetical protein HUJ06_005526 [Nelumbo nucifera]
MKAIYSLLIGILVSQHLAAICVSEGFDFFYFVQQWPGSFCDTRTGCCYPQTGKPASDFSIHGLWPNYNNGSYPSNCDYRNPFNPRMISDLRIRLEKTWPSLACPRSEMLRFWSHEWIKHGTCSESILNQRAYFITALNLRNKVNLLQILVNAGIKPDGRLYSLGVIKEAITKATGYTPGIVCNLDRSGSSQLYQIFLCVDTSGSKFIECPVFPRQMCGSSIKFPSFGASTQL